MYFLGCTQSPLVFLCVCVCVRVLIWGYTKNKCGILSKTKVFPYLMTKSYPTLLEPASSQTAELRLTPVCCPPRGGVRDGVCPNKAPRRRTRTAGRPLWAASWSVFGNACTSTSVYRHVCAPCWQLHEPCHTVSCPGVKAGTIPCNVRVRRDIFQAAPRR